MQGFNMLGLNVHDEKFHKPSAELQISAILEGSSEDFNSFKEVKDYIDSALLGYTPGEGVSLSNYLTKADAASQYLAKGEYLTSQDLPDYSNIYAPKDEYALKSELPSVDGLASESWVEGKGYITSSDIPTSLPASDVSAWAKKSTKPTYTADEVGALSSDTNTLVLEATTEDGKVIKYTIFGNTLTAE